MSHNLQQTLRQRAALARDGFMTRCVDEVPTGRRAPFCCELLPGPSINRSQWDHADNTGRALRAWFGVREMIGATDAGAEVEAGLWQHLQSVLDPDTGLACVPEFSNLPDGPRYYHTWDQGRLFDYLVLRWSEIVESATERTELLAMIRKLQKGLVALSDTAEQADGSTARWWPAEVYFDAEPQPASGNCGPHDFRGWCIGASQFLPPQARLAALTGDPVDLELALEMARGFLAGHERRRGSTAPMFAADGRFYGHFHGAVSGLDGVLQLAVLLYRKGDASLATEWIDLAARVYRWIFDAEKNVNPGSTCGCMSETARDEPHMTSEMCCTADMIEFAIHLAECAALHSRWAALADLWDDVERFVRNEVIKTQVTDIERIAALVVPGSGLTPEQQFDTLKRQEGSWIFGRPFLHDLLQYKRADTLHQAPWLEKLPVADGAAPLVPVLRGAGCCAYSGVRALHAVWRHAVMATPDVLELRIPMEYAADGISVSALPDGTGLCIQASAPRTVRVRIPRYVDAVSVACSSPVGWSDDRRWLTLDLPADSEATISWWPREWTVVETFGPLNADGVVPGVAPDERVRCTMHYRGAEVVRVDPANAVMPFEAGL